MPRRSRRHSRRSAKPAATATRAIAPPRRSRSALRDRVHAVAIRRDGVCFRDMTGHRTLSAVDRSTHMRRVLLAVARCWVWSARPRSGSSPGRSRLPRASLPAHKPNLENGKVMFFAGGCAACHATPKQEDRTRLGGGMELKSPYGSFYPPNISPHPKDGIGAWNEAQVRHRDDEGHVAGRPPLLPVVPLRVLPAHDARRPARHVRLHQDAAAGRGPRARSRHPFSVQYPARARRLEVSLSRRPAASRPIRTSRRNGIAAPIW